MPLESRRSRHWLSASALRAGGDAEKLVGRDVGGDDVSRIVRPAGQWMPPAGVIEGSAIFHGVIEAGARCEGECEALAWSINPDGSNVGC